MDDKGEKPAVAVAGEVPPPGFEVEVSGHGRRRDVEELAATEAPAVIQDSAPERRLASILAPSLGAGALPRAPVVTREGRRVLRHAVLSPRKVRLAWRGRQLHRRRERRLGRRGADGACRVDDCLGEGD